jgi:hypothetical protein
VIVAITEEKQHNSPVMLRVNLKICKKCGGKLARDYEDIACINCGALHDELGNLLKDRYFRPEQLLG